MAQAKLGEGLEVPKNLYPYFREPVKNVQEGDFPSHWKSL
jgi:hypothetical protein